MALILKEQGEHGIVAWAIPKYSKTKVNKAGDVFVKNAPEVEEILEAFQIITNWRSSHGYPINTFQATLRAKLKSVDRDAIVAQRLKRLPSIVAKLRRFRNMKLSRMQDIGGLRAVLKNLKKVSALVEQYRSTRFQHELVSYDDYITKPKSSGYRSVHLVYRYRNPRAPLTMVCSLSSSLERDYNTLGRLPWRQLAPSLRKR